MQNQFVNRLKKIQDEILALKTNSKYTQARPINYTSVGVTQSGVYRITYKSNDENILSFITNATPLYPYGEIKPRTIVNNTQDVEVFIQSDIVQSVDISIVATSEILNFQKVS